MLLALMLVAVASVVGVATLRSVSVAKGILGVGIAPLVGLAVLVVGATWVTFLGLPIVAASGVFGLLAVLGLAGAIGDVRSVLSAPRSVRLSLGGLAMAFAATLVILEIAFWGMQSPLAAHDGADGALHIQIVDALRHG